MDFCEAMKIMKNGGKVTRDKWKDGVYFSIEKGAVKAYQPRLRLFVYHEDIMTSDGWVVVGEEDKKYEFCQIIPFIQQGKKVKLDSWNKEYICKDRMTREIILHSIDCDTPFIPDFESFEAKDWVEVKE